MSLKGKRQFVVQKHDAKKAGEHYDFRLEMPTKDTTGSKTMLISWVIRKGPSMNPLVRRLALETKPHAIAYGKFEGIIEAGQYGAGKTLIWDSGTYEIVKPRIKSSKDLKNIRMFEFRLTGKKLRGNFMMIKTKRGWLMMKKFDKHADTKIDVVKDAPRSVKSGKKIEEITKQDGYIPVVTKGYGI